MFAIETFRSIFLGTLITTGCIICTAELLIQDVSWSRNFKETVGENYFGVCRFVPSPCGVEKDGMCMQNGQCSRAGGNVSGYCQNGFGECCVFVEACSGNRTVVEVDQLVTLLESPPYWTDNVPECSFRFRKEPDICQIRLDFVEYNSSSADSDGNCNEDRLRITNSITVNNGFTTCGNFSGEHMYLSFGSQEMIGISISENKVRNSWYRIIATKIPCNSKDRAPDHCLQYLTKRTGSVKSFDLGGQQQNNQQYTICVRPLLESEQIEVCNFWKPCDGLNASFSISTPVQAMGSLGVPCKADWVQIKGLERMCDNQPFSTMKTNWKPYEVFVNFDGNELPQPPPSFTLPITNGTCPYNSRLCQERSVSNLYNCDCESGYGFECTCIFLEAQGVDNASPLADIDNTGFCMEYAQ